MLMCSAKNEIRRASTRSYPTAYQYAYQFYLVKLQEHVKRPEYMCTCVQFVYIIYICNIYIYYFTFCAAYCQNPKSGLNFKGIDGFWCLVTDRLDCFRESFNV